MQTKNIADVGIARKVILVHKGYLQKQSTYLRDLMHGIMVAQTKEETDGYVYTVFSRVKEDYVWRKLNYVEWKIRLLDNFITKEEVNEQHNA